MKNKGFKVTAIILTLAVTFIAHPFSIIHALAPAEYINSGSGTNNSISYRWDSYVWCMDPNASTDPIQVEVDGNSFWACEYTILEIYFQNPASGTFRVNKPSSGNISDYTFYVNGGICSSRMTTYMTIKFTNVTHVKVVITSYNQAVYSDPTQVFSLGNFSLSYPSDSTQSTLNDIDILLTNMDYTLQDILGYINGSNGIIDYLDQIEAYSEYLDDISLALNDIDNTIDTITWESIPITFKGWTSNFSTYVTTNSSHNGGYYCFEGFTEYLSEYTGNIFKMNVPVSFNTNFTLTVGFYYGGPRGSTNIPINDLIYIKHANYITLYFLLDPAATANLYYQYATFYLQFGGPPSTTYNSTYPLDCSIINPDDIEYWTLKNTITQNQILAALNNISSGSTETTTSQNIDSITNELNQSINDSNQAQESINDMMEDFKLNFDLNNYKFTFDDDFINYYKMKLTDLYDIQELRPFYIIPLVLFILWRLLSG